MMATYYDRKDYRSAEIVARRIYSNPTSSDEQKTEAVKTIFISIFKHADNFKAKNESAKAAREYQGVLKRGVENARSRMQRSGAVTPTAGAPEDPLGIR